VPDRIDLDDRLLAIAREAGLSAEQARPGEEWAAFQARIRANVERAREA
jgi:hypothetical protein